MNHERDLSHRQEREQKKEEYAHPTRGRYLSSMHLTWVAVVGVDNDEVLCELSDRPLTSVAPNVRRIGYEAACLLDQMMQGKPAPTTAPQTIVSSPV